MTEHEKDAFAIYEQMCASSEDRPYSGNSIEELTRKLTAWSADNPALAQLRRAPAETRIAFLKQSLEFLSAESKDHRNFRTISTINDGIRLALRMAVEPLPTPLVHQILSEYRQDHSMGRFWFPLSEFLAVVVKEQVTDEIRAELRRLRLQFAPSPTGKIDEHIRAIRERIGYLMRVEGEKELDPGRGPWSQIVFDSIKEKEDITKAGWTGLLEHFKSLNQTVPSAAWKKRARELTNALGGAEAIQTMLGWLALGPTPGQPSEARSPIEDSPYQKGLIWCVALAETRQSAVAIGDFAVACLRKIPLVGAVSQKVGLACVQALGTMQSDEAVSQLTRLRTKIKYSVAKRLVEKSLQQSAERSGMSREELEDTCVPNYGLDAQGQCRITIGDAEATFAICEDERVRISWRNAQGKAVKSAPSHIRKAFSKEVRSASALAKEIQQTYTSQRARLESWLLAPHRMSVKHWHKYFVEHPLLGLLGRNLIWKFSSGPGSEQSGMWIDSKVSDAGGKSLDLAAAKNVELWHPLSSNKTEIQAWRERILSSGIRQPFRQALRETYELTDSERETKMHSNRFAGVLMRQHQFASLCRARGWNYRLMGTGFDGGNTPQKDIPSWNMRAEFYVDLPPDRDASLRESALNEQSGMGINLFVGSDQVRFYEKGLEMPVDEVPALVYSEVMRDVDLFTSVCAVGDDETWSDQGDRGTGVSINHLNIPQFFAVMEVRSEILRHILPLTRIADRCMQEKAYLVVKGQLGTYRIDLAGATATIDSGSLHRRLNIPRKLLDAIPLNFETFPVDLDYRTELILRKAHLLADDWKIDSPQLVKQLMPE